MKIALVHYHARPGGVTQVLLHSAKALRQRGWDVLTILGEPPTAEWPESAGAWSAVSGLGYRSEGEPGDIPLLHRALQAEVIRHWGQSPDLWLVHNACLAKNVVLCGVIERMAAEEVPVLLQIHDFAEDGRAANLAAARRYHASLSGGGDFSHWLHPSGAGLHRAVLTHRDLALLQRCGFAMDRLHWMPNAVSVIPSGAECPRDPQLSVSPVRGVRRKNFGELCLLAQLGQAGGGRIVTTLAPVDPSSRRAYDFWVACAKRMRLPIEFGVVSSGVESYPDLMRKAGRILTTSVSEGFGFAWLEPWLLGLTVAGRDLPDLTDDFRSFGWEFPQSYERINIPVSWVGEARLRAMWLDALERMWADCGLAVPPDAPDLLWSAVVQEDQVDFGRLDEALQERVLAHLHHHPEEMESLGEVLPAVSYSEEFLLGQAARIQKALGIAAVGDRLDQLCRLVAAGTSGPLEASDPQALLRHFLDPTKFWPLKH